MHLRTRDPSSSCTTCDNPAPILGVAVDLAHAVHGACGFPVAACISAGAWKQGRVECVVRGLHAAQHAFLVHVGYDQRDADGWPTWRPLFCWTATVSPCPSAGRLFVPVCHTGPPYVMGGCDMGSIRVAHWQWHSAALLLMGGIQPCPCRPSCGCWLTTCKCWP